MATDTTSHRKLKGHSQNPCRKHEWILPTIHRWAISILWNVEARWFDCSDIGYSSSHTQSNRVPSILCLSIHWICVFTVSILYRIRSTFLIDMLDSRFLRKSSSILAKQRIHLSQTKSRFHTTPYDMIRKYVIDEVSIRS